MPSIVAIVAAMLARRHASTFAPVLGRSTRPALMSACVVTALACSGKRASSSAPPEVGEASPSVVAVATQPAPPPIVSSSSTAPASTAAPPIASLHVPSTVTPGQRRPFILFLHGLGATGKVLDDHLGLSALAAERRFSYAVPDGATNSKGQHYWNASSACCDFDHAGVPHVAELRRLIESATANPAVDPHRLYVVGYSNGGFMAHRLACDIDGLAAVVSVAGAGPAEGDPCAPRGPVAVLEIHGDADDTIRYEGGHALGRADLPAHPSALATVAGWARREGCAGDAVPAGSVDLEDKLEGAETSIFRFRGCRQPVALWSVHGGNHFIGMGHRGLEQVVTYLEAQVRP